MVTVAGSSCWKVEISIIEIKIRKFLRLYVLIISSFNLTFRHMKSRSDQVESTREHDKYLITEREKQKVVLEEIRNFRLSDENEIICSSVTSPSSSPEVSKERSLKEELKVVKSILEHYENFVGLYPNINSMERSTNIDELVKTRIQILYAWYNITTDLYAKIREVCF